MSKSFILPLYIATLTLLLSSCVTTRHTNYLQKPKDLIPAYKDTFSYNDYRLKESDRLYIQVFSTDDKTNTLFNNSSVGTQMATVGASSDNQDLYTYVIQTNGSIDFPIVGEIPLTGKTIRQSKEIIEQILKSSYLGENDNCSVDVRMLGRSFSVIGNGKSGRFNFPREKINVFQALALIGDFGTFTDRSKIKILRTGKNGNAIKTFDLRSVDIINSEFYYIEPDDVIFVQPMNEQFFGITTLWGAIATTISAGSFFYGLYYYLFVPKSK
jgi:polysaccharide export outer membrane protein